MERWLKHANGSHAKRWGQFASETSAPGGSGRTAFETDFSRFDHTHPGVVPQRRLLTCPECGVPVRVDRIKKHLARVHYARLATQATGATARGFSASGRKILFLKLKWPDWGEFAPFDPGCNGGIVLRRNKTHVLAVFPYRDGSSEYIWFERPQQHKTRFWDTVYNAPVEQLRSSFGERLQIWQRISSKWHFVCTKAQTMRPPSAKRVNSELLARFASPPLRTRKLPKNHNSRSEPRLFVQGGLPGLGKR